MTAKRWWDLAVAGTVALMIVIVMLNSEVESGNRLGGIVALLVVGLFYAVYGRRAIGTATGSVASEAGASEAGASAADRVLHGDRAASVATRVVLIVGCGAAAAFAPSMATVQALAFPLLWVLTDQLRRAIALSAVLSASVGTGLYISLGRTWDALAEALLIEGISFVFALALGAWISHIADEGNRQRRLVEQLRATQGELALMHREAGSAAERERLARDIHDTIAQSLTSLVMLAQRARRELAQLPGGAASGSQLGQRNTATDASAPQPNAIADVEAQVEATLDLLESTARDALTEARSLVASMSAVRSGADSTLAETVTRLAERFERETGIQVRASVCGLDSPAGSGAAGAAGGLLDRELEVVLLRCAQEGLANVRKHSRASSAWVTIDRVNDAQPPQVVLEVRDNGRGPGGYRPDTENGFGIAGMHDRVSLVGGTLQLSAAEGGGTVLRVTIPVRFETRPPPSVVPEKRTVPEEARQGRLEGPAPQRPNPDKRTIPEEALQGRVEGPAPQRPNPEVGAVPPETTKGDAQ